MCLTLFHSPAIYSTEHNDRVLSESRSILVNRWIEGSPDAGPHYMSNFEVDWDDILRTVEKLTERKAYQGIGLLNFNQNEIEKWQQHLPYCEHIDLHLDHVSNMTWESLYPEWIDEEEEFEVPSCPSLPSLQVPGKSRIDLIAIKLPCKTSKDWSRDVARLHLQLAAARFAATVKGYHPVHILLVTDRFPIPNLFRCKELIIRKGKAWLYKPDLNILREKVRLPVGSCELAVPLKGKED